MNQWFYLLAGGILAALLLGFLLPLLQVLDVSAACSIPSTAVNSENVLIKVTLNRNSVRGSLSNFLPLRLVLIRANLVSHLGKTSVIRPMVVDTINQESWVFAATAPLKRGIYRFESLEIWSSFPFGLFWWCRKLESIKNNLDPESSNPKPLITVYPPMEQVEGNFLYKIRAATDSPLGLLSSKIPTNATSSSVRSLRDFAHGDSPRLVHWPSSARAGRLLVREFDAEGLPGFDLLLNMTAPWQTSDQFELAVSVIYSLLHLGFKLSGAPELYLIPDLDIEPIYLPGFMADLPALPSGLARSSHLLARVMQVTDRSPDMKIIDLKGSSHQALITVRPAKQFDAEADPIKDRSLAYKVELAVIPRTLDLNTGAKPTSEVHMPVHELGIVNRRVGGSPTGRVISTIERVEEIARL
jgi:hypothetical protein